MKHYLTILFHHNHLHEISLEFLSKNSLLNLAKEISHSFTKQ